MCVCAYNIFLMLFFLLSLFFFFRAPCALSASSIIPFSSSSFFFLPRLFSLCLLLLLSHLLTLRSPIAAWRAALCPRQRGILHLGPTGQHFHLRAPPRSKRIPRASAVVQTFSPPALILRRLFTPNMPRAGVFRPVIQGSRPAPVPIRPFGANIVVRHFWPSPADGAGFSSRRGPVTVDASEDVNLGRPPAGLHNFTAGRALFAEQNNCAHGLRGTSSTARPLLTLANTE